MATETKFVSIPLGKNTWRREIANEPEVFMVNRFFESTPTSLDDQISMILRPTLSRRTEVGNGPVRTIYQQDGVFDGDMFVVSDTGLFRVHKDATDASVPDIVTTIVGEVRGTGTPYMTAAGTTGGTKYLWVADGFSLQYFTEATASATSTLTFLTLPVDGDTFTIGVVTYTWKNTPVAGTDVQIGVSVAASIVNAVTKIGAHSADVTVTSSTVLDLTITAVASGPTGNTIATTETGTSMSWPGGFMFGGSDGTSLVTVPLPDDVSATSLDYIKGYVIVTVGEPFAQRFYWVQPGGNSVDPLDFAEAESSLDPVLNVRTISDQFWLFGTNTTEPWYVTGDAATPMAPVQGRPYNRGIWEGTAVKVNDSVILVGQDGRVYDVGSGPNPISYPGIEERIRRAMIDQAYGGTA